MFKINCLAKPAFKRNAVFGIVAALLFFGCAGSGTRGSSGARPAWVDNPEKDFPQARYLAQVGFGPNRAQAEKSALSNLSAVFGQSVQSETTSFYSYAQALKNGTIEFEENKSLESEVTTSVDMDSLLGAEIPEVWFDGRGTHYAIAVMERSKVTSLYTDLFRANQRLLSSLTSIAPAERNSISGYSRFLLAAAIADVNRSYASTLTVLGGSTGTSPGQMRTGDEYRLQAAEIAGNIPIAVSISGDTSNRRIANAFARALNQLGFVSGGTNSRYVLEGEFEITSRQTDDRGNIYLRYSLTAGLKDNSGSTVILPFNATGREGHLNESSAQDLVMRTLENRIIAEFADSLQNYLSASLPGLR